MQAARGASLNPSDQASGPRSAQRLLLLLAGGLLAADQLAKVWAVAALSDGRRIDLLGWVFGLRLTYNPGAAFGTGGAFTPVITVIALVAALVVVRLSFRVRDRFWAVGLGCLLAGVVGNLCDRLFRAPGVFRGHVVDFLELPNWPIFNIADVCINVAAVVIIVQAFRGVRLDGTRDEDHQEKDV